MCDEKFSSMLTRHAGVLKAFINDFEKLPLLGIHVRSFQVVDTEKCVVKLTEILLNEITAVHVHSSGSASILVIETLDVESIFGDCSLGGLLVRQEIPQV